jgi:cytochrome P450
MSDEPLPPGRLGLPWVGELPLLLRDGYGWVEERARRHGPIFRTRILGRPTAVITGPDASGKFIDDEDIQRAGAMPSHVEALFGGRGVLPLLDGPAHRARKRVIMAAFTREAVASYLPGIERLVRATLGSWADAGEVRWPAPLKRLAVEAIAATVIGLPGSELDGVMADYERVLAGFSGLPIPLPFTAYQRARRALRRILTVFEGVTRDHLTGGGDDGLSRMLAARRGDDSPTVEVIARELHHVVVAGLIVWAWLMSAAVELDRAPAVRDRLRDEVLRLPAGPLTLEGLAALPTLRQVSMEVRRLTPVVSVFFGRARRTFRFAGHRVPEGWMVLWGIRSSHIRPEVYSDPLRFDPDRFAEPRAEHHRHPSAFVPNGAGDALAGHKCAGYELAPLVLELFLVELVRGFDWSFPDPGWTLDYGQVPPAPRDGLRVRLTRR